MAYSEIRAVWRLFSCPTRDDKRNSSGCLHGDVIMSLYLSTTKMMMPSLTTYAAYKSCMPGAQPRLQEQKPAVLIPAAKLGATGPQGRDGVFHSQNVSPHSRSTGTSGALSFAPHRSRMLSASHCSGCCRDTCIVHLCSDAQPESALQIHILHRLTAHSLHAVPV